MQGNVFLNDVNASFQNQIYKPTQPSTNPETKIKANEVRHISKSDLSSGSQKSF